MKSTRNSGSLNCPIGPNKTKSQIPFDKKCTPQDFFRRTLVCVRRQGIQKERTSRFGDARGQHTIKSVKFQDFKLQKFKKTN